MGLLISDSSISSSIVLGIIVGVTLAGKIDQLNLMIGLGLSLTMAVLLGFNSPEIPLLAVIAAASLKDEVGHDRFASRRILTRFFHFRMVLKTTMILLAVLNWIDLVHMLGFFCFDLSYDITELLLRRRADL